MIVEVLEEISVLLEANPVADAMRAADVDGLGDGRGPISLPGVDGGVDVVVSHQLERLQVVLGREVLLRAGQVEPDDPAVLVSHGQLRHVQ